MSDGYVTRYRQLTEAEAAVALSLDELRAVADEHVCRHHLPFKSQVLYPLLDGIRLLRAYLADAEHALADAERAARALQIEIDWRREAMERVRQVPQHNSDDGRRYMDADVVLDAVDREVRALLDGSNKKRRRP